MKMQKRFYRFYVLPVLAFLFAQQLSFADDIELSKSDRQWLELEVRALITEEEVQIFEQLGSKKDRELFKEMFWARRDPDVMTPENEFKEVFEDRVRFANRNLRVSGRKGVTSDLAKVYLLLGPPDYVQRSVPSGQKGMNQSGTAASDEHWNIGNRPESNQWYPAIGGVLGVQLTESEIRRMAWRYDPDPDAGITSELKFAFDLQRSFGFRLVDPPEAEPILESLKANCIYHPEIDYRRDPQGHLMPLPARFDPNSAAKEVLRKMRDTNTEAAEVSFETDMAFYQATSGTYIPLLFEIPAEHLRWKRDGADVTVFGLIETVDGRPIRQFEERSTVTRPQGGRAVLEMPIQLEPGSYTFNLGVMDLDSKKAGTKRTPVFVPSFKQDELDRSSVLLYRESRRVDKPAGTLGHAFQFGQVKFTPAGGRAYRPKDNLGILFFVYGFGVGEDGQARLSSDYTLYRDGEKQGEIPTQSLQVGTAQALASVQIPLATFEPGDYQVEVRVTDHVTDKILSNRLDFVLEPEPYAVGEYSELVESFRDGRFEEAAHAIGLVPRSSLKGTAKDYRKKTSSNDLLKAAALLHTEAAITNTKDVVFHLGEAREFLNRISDRPQRTDYLRRWFIAVSCFLRSTPLGWGALSVVGEALELYPNDIGIQLAVGSVYESAGRRQVEGMLDRAEGLYREILAKRPENVEAHMRLGRVLQMRKDWAGAIRELKWSLEQGDDHSTRFVTLMLLGEVYYQLGDLQNAVQSYRGALEIDPGCQVAAVALSHALHRSGDWASSREVMSRFLDREVGSYRGPDEWKRYISGRVDQLHSVLQEMREEVLR